MALRVGRRIQLIGLAKGWNAWHEQYVEEKRQMQMLQAAGARLTRPMLVATFMHWRDDWDAAEKAAAARAAMGVQELLDEATEGRRKAEMELRSSQKALKQQLDRAVKEREAVEGLSKQKIASLEGEVRCK